MKKLLIILALALPLWVSAQNQEDVSLAYSYYNSREYEKAVYLFENLFNQTHAKNYFNYYIKCLESLGELDKAEKAVKKQIEALQNVEMSEAAKLNFAKEIYTEISEKATLIATMPNFDGVSSSPTNNSNYMDEAVKANIFAQALNKESSSPKKAEETST